MNREPKYKPGDCFKTSNDAIFLVTDILDRRKRNLRYRVLAMSSRYHGGRFVFPISRLDNREDLFRLSDQEKAFFLLKLENYEY